MMEYSYFKRDPDIEVVRNKKKKIVMGSYLYDDLKAKFQSGISSYGNYVTIFALGTESRQSVK